MAIRETIYLHQIPPEDVKEAPLWWHTAGLSYTATGYGRRIPTPRMVRVNGSPRWRRVYCCIHSNIGTCYILHADGDWTVIS